MGVRRYERWPACKTNKFDLGLLDLIKTASNQLLVNTGDKDYQKKIICIFLETKSTKPDRLVYLFSIYLSFFFFFQNHRPAPKMNQGDNKSQFGSL